MATKRDLVEAYSFSRRRLVTAFVSGAPGGREVEPTRPGRTIVGGLALAVLLVAGAAIAGVFAPKDPADWNKPGLIVSKETGAAYVILEESEHPVLRPVINITSARLILGTGAEPQPRILAQATIDAQTIGDDIGILGAPASLPASSLLVDDGWTACTADRRGLRLAVAEDPQATPAPDHGFVVESEGAHYLIAQGVEEPDIDLGAYRYRIPEGNDQDNMLDVLGLPARSAAVRVPEEWLALFPAGGDLNWKAFGLTGFGDPVEEAGDQAVPAGARVGDVVTTDGESMLLTANGPIKLNEFALAVYRHSPSPAGRLTPAPRRGGAPVEWAVDTLPQVDRAKSAYAAAHWPKSTLQATGGDHCAVLDTAPGTAPTVQLATDATGDASPVDLQRDSRSVAVQAGRGAYVLSGDWDETSGGSPFVVDAKGQAYPLVGPDVAARLGYADHQAGIVPDSWIQLFEPGVNLSVDAALCPPDHEQGRSCD
ncbi:type VII secretion protein EccB [Nocardioides koreensis]|uniref:Type VII secretion protein EccB n=1 Tax=Nocardioides koreensis TaxID=433651 RepID=A0ABP5KZN7_9ACTN